MFEGEGTDGLRMSGWVMGGDAVGERRIGRDEGKGSNGLKNNRNTEPKGLNNNRNTEPNRLKNKIQTRFF